MSIKRNNLRKHLYGIIFCWIILGLIVSCSRSGSSSDDDDDHPNDVNDTTYPVIVIDRPVANQVYANGDTIKIQGRVTDNSLYRGKIKITNDVNGFLINEQLYEIHYQQSYDFSFSHRANVSVVADYTVSVEYEDHGLNTTVKTVKVKVNL